MEVTPYHFKVSSVIVFDRVSKYDTDISVPMSDVLADNGKYYNIWNPLFNPVGDEKELVRAKGVLRAHLREALKRIVNNFYNKAHTVVLDNEKLPKNTQALSGLLNPLITQIQNAFPFKPDFVLSTQQIRIVVETETSTEERPVKEDRKDSDSVFSDFISVNGWTSITNVDTENLVTRINLTTCAKVLATNVTPDNLIQSISAVRKMIEDTCNGLVHCGVLFNSSSMTPEDYLIFSSLVASGFKVITLNTNPDPAMYWMPPTKTAREEKVMRSLGNQVADILLVK